MNCKPDQTARIIFTPDFPENEGKLVHVDRASRHLPGFWEVTALCTFSAGRHEFDREKKMVPPGTGLTIADEILRPVRDPGEDAVDEMVLKVGKPSHEEVTA